MKKIVKKNQVIITALSIMIAIAGYLNFSGKDLPLGKDSVSSVMENSTNDMSSLEGAKGNNDDAPVSAPVQDTVDKASNKKNNKKDKETAIGEAVLTGTTGVSDFVSKAKLNREQTRAKSKELLMEIIDNETLSEKEKKDAINQMLSLTGIMEKEAATEQLLGAKGFQDSVVSISEKNVDVLVNQSEISEVEKAQIEDIVQRKTERSLDQIVITTIKLEK